MSNWQNELFRALGRITRDVLRSVTRSRTRPRIRRFRPDRYPDHYGNGTPPRHMDQPLRSDYPGDYFGLPKLVYGPKIDKHADPGEVVWGWVPYEEDHTRGKDRPVLIIGRDGGWLLGLPMSSINHDLDAHQEAAAGRFWVNVGSGDWDVKRRESQVRVDRIIRMSPDSVRRIAGKVTAEAFDDVAAGLARHWDD